MLLPLEDFFDDEEEEAIFNRFQFRCLQNRDNFSCSLVPHIYFGDFRFSGCFDLRIYVLQFGDFS